MINTHLPKGRPVSLCVLDYGMFRVHAGPRVVGICGFLIRTDADECILIDSGFPAKYADDPKAATLTDGLDSFSDVLNCSAENLVAAQLELAGVGPNELTLLIQSHTHIGGLAAFLSNAPKTHRTLSNNCGLAVTLTEQMQNWAYSAAMPSVNCSRARRA